MSERYRLLEPNDPILNRRAKPKIKLETDEQWLKRRRRRKILHRAYAGGLLLFTSAPIAYGLKSYIDGPTELPTKEDIDVISAYAALSLGIVSLTYDLVRGTHHYLPMKISQKLIGSQRIQNSIQEIIDFQNDVHMKDILDKRRQKKPL